MDANTLGLMAAGFLHVFSPMNLGMMILGVTIGIVIGCMPGLSAAMGVALLLPLTFGMKPETGLIMLGAIYCGAIFGGSISAILIHTPGTPASAATAIDGYQLTLKGKAGKALGTACTASFFGGLLSCISLYFFAPALAQLAMKFGSPEYFWLALFGLTIIAGVTSGSMVKGLMSGAFGLILSTIGMDPMEGVERYMFGIDALYNGINVTCAMIGLFSMSQVFMLIEKAIKERGNVIDFEDSVILKAKELAQIFPHVIRSWIIGNIIGILPGAGASIACFLGYDTAKKFSKRKDEFGKGSIEGVAASEAANNAVTGAVLHVDDRFGGVPSVRAHLPPVRRYPDSLRIRIVRGRFFCHQQQFCGSGYYVPVRLFRLSDAETGSEYSGGGTGADSGADRGISASSSVLLFAGS